MALPRHLGLGVIETRWFDERHHTVRPLFEFLSYAFKDRPDAFTYERFVGAVSFREPCASCSGSGDIEYLYVAAHGDFGKIEAPYGSGLSRTFLRNTICEVNSRRRRLKGVLFGPCKFGDAHNLVELLRPRKFGGERVINRLIWAGGYGQEIEYTRSCCSTSISTTSSSGPRAKSEITGWRRRSNAQRTLPASSRACRCASWPKLSTATIGISPRTRTVVE